MDLDGFSLFTLFEDICSTFHYSGSEPNNIYSTSILCSPFVAIDAAAQQKLHSLTLAGSLVSRIEWWGVSDWDLTCNVSFLIGWSYGLLVRTEPYSVNPIYKAFIKSVSEEILISDHWNTFSSTLPKAKLIQDQHSCLTGPDKCSLGHSVAPF